MVRIRLFRVGKKNQPSYKIVVTPKENPPQGGNFLDKIGHYNPTTKECEIDKEKAEKWLSDGAQPSNTVYNLFVENGIIEGEKKINHKDRAANKEKEEEKSEEKENNKKEEKEEKEEKNDKKNEDNKKKDSKETKKEKED